MTEIHALTPDRLPDFLAYRAGQVVGRCNAAPRTMMAAFDDEPDPDAAMVGMVTCFLVLPAHRRSGVAVALLDAACAGLGAQGLTVAGAMPKPDPAGDAENHYGPLSLYLKAGFTVHRPGKHGCVHVRRALT